MVRNAKQPTLLLMNWLTPVKGGALPFLSCVWLLKTVRPTKRFIAICRQDVGGKPQQ
jgi:hypothetical protein